MPSRIQRGLAVVVASVFVSTAAFAYPGAPTGSVTDEAKAEAKKRVKKALGLFEEGDKSGALGEFRRAYELSGSPVVLYNMGLVFDANEQYVEADAALTEVLAIKPDPLKPEWHKRALEAQAHARSRIGTIEIAPTLKDPPPVGTDDPLKDAVIELDGIDVGRWPLPSPLRAGVGKHTVGVLLAGYQPVRVAVLVAGEATVKASLELVAMTGKAAQLRIVSNVAKAQIVIDGEVVGQTPLVASLAIMPGKHVIELKRKGFATGSTVVNLTSGAIGEAKIDLREDPNEVQALGAKVTIVPTEEETRISIDGLAYRANTAIALAPGPHRLRVDLPGFRTIERDIDADEGKTSTVHVVMDPTPDTLVAHDASVSSHRTWGYVGIGVGGVVLVGSGLYYLSLLSKKSDIENRIITHNDTFKTACDLEPSPALQAQCKTEKESLDSEQSSNRLKRNLSLVGMAVGLVGIGAGIYSLYTSPDSHRYDRLRHDDEAKSKPRVSVVAMPSFVGFSLSGVF